MNTGPLNSSAAAQAAAAAEARRRAEEARRRAEEARRKAEEARRKAAEEAARKKAAEEAARKKAEEAQKQKMAEKSSERREGYSEKPEQKPEMPPQLRRAMEMEERFSASSKPMSASDSAKTSLELRISAHEGAVQRKIDGADKVPGEAKDAVKDMNEKIVDQANGVVAQADEQVAQIHQMAKEASEGKTPEQKKAIMDEADAQSAKIYQEAEKQVDKVLDQTYQKTGEILEKSEKHDNGGGVGGWLKDRVDDVKDLASDAWNAAKDFAGDVVGAVTGAADAVGDFATDTVKEFGEFVANAAYDKVIDPALDHSALGEDDEYSGEKTGALGDLITNRLEPGESVFLKLEANAEIGGIQVGAGAQVQIKRVPKTDENGNVVEEPKDAKGRGPTELEVTLLADARVGVGLDVSAGSGPKGKAMGDDRTVGAGASASASVSAGVEGQAEFKFRFDPNKQQDMDDMTGIFKTAAKTGLESAIPGIGSVLAASNVPDLAKDAMAFGRHMTEMSGTIGAYANASASASVSAGALQNKKPEGTEGTEGTEEGGLMQDLKNQGLDAAQLKAQAAASLGGEVKMGISKDFRTGQTTLSFTLAGQASVEAGAAGLNKGVGGSRERSIEVVLDKNGQISGVNVNDTQEKRIFEGSGSQDVQGKRLNTNALARLTDKDEVTVTYSMKPEAVEAFKDQWKNDKLGALGTLAGDFIHTGSKDLEVSSVTGTHTSQVEFGADLKVIQAKVTLGHGQDYDLTAGAKK